MILLNSIFLSLLIIWRDITDCGSSKMLDTFAQLIQEVSAVCGLRRTRLSQSEF